MLKNFIRTLGFFYTGDKGGETGTGGATTPVVQRERQAMPAPGPEGEADRQAMNAKRHEAAEAEKQARIIAATTDSQLTTVEHKGKRTGEPDKPDHIEDAKVGEPSHTAEVGVAPVTRQTVDPLTGDKSEKVVDVNVVSPEPRADVAAAKASAEVTGDEPPANVPVGVGTGTLAQQADRANIDDALTEGAKPLATADLSEKTAGQNEPGATSSSERKGKEDDDDGLEAKTVPELREIADKEGVTLESGALKADVIEAIRAKRGE